MELYVGNLPFNTTEESLRTLFEAHGQVSMTKVIMDRDTGRSRGFGFVDVDNGDAAIQALDGTEFEGRTLRVNQSRGKQPRR